MADLELNPLVLLKRPITASEYFCVVNEYILCTAVRSDETEAFVAVEPLHSSLCHTFSNFFLLEWMHGNDIHPQGSTLDGGSRYHERTPAWSLTN